MGTEEEDNQKRGTVIISERIWVGETLRKDRDHRRATTVRCEPSVC